MCDYSDAYILVTGKISVVQAADCIVAFKNCAPFISCTVKVNDEHIEEAKDLETIMPLYNLIEYSDNGTYKMVLTNYFQNGNTVQDGADARKSDNAKIVVPLKYLSNFFRALEMS